MEKTINSFHSKRNALTSVTSSNEFTEEKTKKEP